MFGREKTGGPAGRRRTTRSEERHREEHGEREIDVIRLHGADGDWWREEYTRKTQRDSEVTGTTQCEKAPKGHAATELE